MTYEGILHEQLCMVKALLIRAQAASYGHDPLVVLKYSRQRAQECVQEDAQKLIQELETMHGACPSHRITAYGAISNSLARQMETVIFDQHFDKIIQMSHEFKLREEELQAKENAAVQEVCLTSYAL